MTADRGRAEVYAAEGDAFTGTLAEEPLGGAEVALLVGGVVASPGWASTGLGEPRLRPARRDATRSSAAVRGGQWEVRLAPGQATAATLAHELAHVVAGVGAGHGPGFRRAHLDVVGEVLGWSGRQALAEAYARRGLSVRDGPDRPDGPDGPDASWSASSAHGGLGALVVARAGALFGHDSGGAP